MNYFEIIDDIEEDIWGRIDENFDRDQGPIDSNLRKFVTSEIYDEVHRNISLDTLEIVRDLRKDWSKKESWELYLRVGISIVLFGILYKQIHFIHYLMTEIGKGAFNFDSNVLSLFVTVVFVEMVAMTTLTIKYLFAERKTTPLEIIQNVINNLSNSNVNYIRNKSSDNSSDL